MSKNLSRRTLAKGAAWTTPTVLATSIVPAYAASPAENQVTCPISNISNGATGLLSQINPAGSNGYTSGTRLGIDFVTGPVNPQPISGTTKITTGLYMIPGCGNSTCVAGQTGGFNLPAASDEVVVFTRYGVKHKGKIVSATPYACSPVTNGGVTGHVEIETDLTWTGLACKPQNSDANYAYQVSIPYTIIYLDGLTPVKTTTGDAGCCLYLNMIFSTDSSCPGIQRATEVWWTAGAPGFVTPTPKVTSTTRLADNNSIIRVFCSSKDTFTLTGLGLSAVTGATFNGKPVKSVSVVDDHTVTITFPTDGSAGDWIAVNYPLVLQTSSGQSISVGDFTRYLIC